MFDIDNLLVEAESVDTGERLIGYVCCCAQCRKIPNHYSGDVTRPLGLLTAKDCSYGNVKVYTDTMEFINQNKIL